MTEKVMDILTERLDYTEKYGITGDRIASEEIAQMFCDKFIEREYECLLGIVGSADETFISIVKKSANSLGFTEQQIINSLEKLKDK